MEVIIFTKNDNSAVSWLRQNFDVINVYPGKSVTIEIEEQQLDDLEEELYRKKIRYQTD